MKKITVLFILCCLKTMAQNIKDCADCSTRAITAEQIKQLSIDEIRFLTNDLFARKGYVFQDDAIDAYYADKTWYQPVNANYTIAYTPIEKQNIKLFQDRTKQLKSEREELVNELKKFKNLIDNPKELQKQFGYNVEENNNFIKNVLDEIFIDDIHWFKKKGLYTVTKDNGDIVKEYALKINGSKVTLHLGIKGGSALSNGDTMYQEKTAKEISYAYLFEFINGKLTFQKVVTAG